MIYERTSDRFALTASRLAGCKQMGKFNMKSECSEAVTMRSPTYTLNQLTNNVEKSDMDRKVRDFMELVDCRAEEVLDIPADRLRQPPQSVTASPEARLKSVGEKQIYFGKHKGKKLREVPTDYLKWALGEKPKDRSFRKFQRDAKEFLGASGDRVRSRKRRSERTEYIDPLCREFLEIVRHR